MVPLDGQLFIESLTFGLSMPRDELQYDNSLELGSRLLNPIGFTSISASESRLN